MKKLRNMPDRILLSSAKSACGQVELLAMRECGATKEELLALTKVAIKHLNRIKKEIPHTQLKHVDGRYYLLNLNSTQSETKQEDPMSLEYDSEKGGFTRPGDLYLYFKKQGFFFSKEILTRYFLSLKTKPFVILTGISGTGKTKIAQIFADYICQDETPEEKGKRIAFVPVKPDWMDNKGLLGYYNLLDEKYHDTPVLRLLLDAEQNTEKPYFIILDEMNLAKVEQYFSDFLSIMESRTLDNPKGEALHLHSAGKVQAQDGKGDVPPSFNIPPNVYFTGTVNIDESTYMFSSKVLDRANVIEFNDVDLANYENGVDSSGRFVLKDADVRNRLLPGENGAPFSSKTDYSGALIIAPDVHGYLEGLLNILRPYHLHFGYRVINEIAHFVRNAHELIQNFKLEEVMDIQILQKILPKFHGTQGKLEAPLNKLFDFCNAEDARFPRSAQKLERMLQNLKVQGYTSFIE